MFTSVGASISRALQCYAAINPILSKQAMPTGADDFLYRIPKSQAKSNPSLLPLDLFKSGRLLCLTPECKGGLVLQKRFYADFVGPGAAVGGSFDIKCISVYVAGSVKFYSPATNTERATAYQKRMAYTQKIQEILLEQSSLNCACLMVNQLCQWIGVDEAKKIPCELVAQLVGLAPKTVASAWQQSAGIIQKLECPNTSIGY